VSCPANCKGRVATEGEEGVKDAEGRRTISGQQPDKNAIAPHPHSSSPSSYPSLSHRVRRVQRKSHESGTSLGLPLTGGSARGYVEQLTLMGSCMSVEGS